jgi:hypothetical protein
MKYWMVILSVLTGFWCVPSMAQAKCGNSHVAFSPAKRAKDVPRNVRPFLSLYGIARHSLPLIRGGHFASKGHRVYFDVEVHKSSRLSMRMMYLSLRLKGKLKPGRTYSLRLNRKVRITRGGPRPPNSVFTSYSFTTGTVSDTRAPSRATSLTSSGYKMVRYGCGPARRIALSAKGQRDNLTTGKRLRYQMDVRQTTKRGAKRILFSVGTTWKVGAFSLGHGMCSGNYATLPKGTYIIRVRAVDEAGNAGAWSASVKATVR